MSKKLLLVGGVIGVFSCLLIATAFYLLGSDAKLTSFEDYIKSTTIGSQGADGHIVATYLGTSTLLFSDGKHSVMIDGFFTRPSPRQLLLGNIQPDTALIKQQLQRLKVDKLDVLAVAHSHHDHGMDAAEVAKQTGAMVFGSESTMNIARGADLPNHQMAVVDDKRTLVAGSFTVTMIKSEHTKMPAPLAWVTGIDSSITEPLSTPATLFDYREGGSYSVVIEHPLGNVVVQASSGFVKGALAPYSADVVFMGIAGLNRQSEQFRADYYREVVGAVGASRVIPIHWDNFMRPIGDGLVPFHPLINDAPASLNELSQRLVSDHKSMILLPAWDTMVLY